MQVRSQHAGLAWKPIATPIHSCELGAGAPPAGGGGGGTPCATPRAAATGCNLRRWRGVLGCRGALLAASGTLGVSSRAANCTALAIALQIVFTKRDEQMRGLGCSGDCWAGAVPPPPPAALKWRATARLQAAQGRTCPFNIHYRGLSVRSSRKIRSATWAPRGGSYNGFGQAQSRGRQDDLQGTLDATVVRGRRLGSGEKQVRQSRCAGRLPCMRQQVLLCLLCGCSTLQPGVLLGAQPSGAGRRWASVSVGDRRASGRQRWAACRAVDSRSWPVRGPQPALQRQWAAQQEPARGGSEPLSRGRWQSPGAHSAARSCGGPEVERRAAAR